MRVIVFICAIVCMLMCNDVYADTSAEIISIDKDVKGNIRVWTQYKIDGVEVDSQYPTINGKEVYATRYNSGSFLGMSDAQIKARITEDVTKHTETLIKKTYIPIANDDIIATHLKDVVGSKVTTTDVTIESDTDGDGINDKEVTIKTDGTSTSTVITP